MILISYDISDDKKRAKFNKYIKKFGHMLQYSVYEIDNSNKILNGIIADINNKFIKMFDETDSVYIFKLSESCETIKFGYARHDDSDLLIVE
ncbi:MAG TPA: CRISPR-associated endonuclease Cas2 [Ruminococcaceae bacterium]|nr:CRISPR-associated endonuclease Cas2 [Oscillospiraceae bacterium]